MAARTTASRPRRDRTTRRAVLVSDWFARNLIRAAGGGTIAAVSLVCVYLVWVVVPLFRGGTAAEQRVLPRPDLGAATPVQMLVDEYCSMAAVVDSDGSVTVVELDGGRVLQRRRLAEGGIRGLQVDASGRFVFGTDAGRVVAGTIDFAGSFHDTPPGPAAGDLAVGQRTTDEVAVIERLGPERWRSQRLRVSSEAPLPVADGVAVRLVDVVDRSSGAFCAVLTDDGRLHTIAVTEKRNMLTGKVTRELRRGEMQLAGGDPPERLLVAGVGNDVLLLWSTGRMTRIDSRDAAAPQLAEHVDLFGGDTRHMGIAGLLLGNTTLLVGDSDGDVSCWFKTKPEGAETVDGGVFVRAHRFAREPRAPVTAVSHSTRSRLLAWGDAVGGVALVYVTTHARVLELALDGRIELVAVAPKEDAVVVLGADAVVVQPFAAQHPEASLEGTFTAVWYEGEVKPEHVWQSSSGSDDFEPKLGLVPLVFGTLKATLYSLLFAVPLALLAAIYTSEFLHPRTRGRVKPTIELMASLPSVVLGFLAGLVFAPFVESWLMTVLLALVTIPLGLLLGAHVWQAMSRGRQLRLQRHKLGLVAVAMPTAIAVAVLLAPVVEELAFGGSLRLWLDGAGGAWSGWAFLLLPLVGLGVAVALPRSRSQSAAGRSALVRFAAGAAATVMLAAVAGLALQAAGFDPRGGVVDTYVQRNALVVGFVMGFAVIPIIYTIAEDALSSVPEHLRAASLATGATPWQTATRLIVPTAMSGLFSAVMVGLGRAVGETMIVLMAAGNTPILEMNIFNGMRTLAANIAYELPEAVRDSTHYRMLFFAALVLFTFTFVLNTVAELVRQRFRRRAFQL